MRLRDVFIRVTGFFWQRFCHLFISSVFLRNSIHITQMHIYFDVFPFQLLVISGEKEPQQSLKMKGLYLVEPLVALYAFSSFLMYPLIQQYVYRRLWQELTNSSFPATDNNSRCAEPSSNQSSPHEVSCFIGHKGLLAFANICKKPFLHFFPPTKTSNVHSKGTT